MNRRRSEVFAFGSGQTSRKTDIAIETVPQGMRLAEETIYAAVSPSW